MRWKLPRFPQQSPLLWCREKGLSWGVQGFACVAVAWIVAQSFWWLSAPASPAMVAKASPSLAEQANRVIERHFFDVAAAPRQSQSIDPGESPPPGSVDSRWRLLGTYVDAVRGSSALLARDGSPDVLLVRVGDEVVAGQKVMDIQTDGIELGSDAQRIKLTLRPSTQNGREQDTPPGGLPGSQGMQAPPSGSAPFIKDSR